VSSLSLQYKDVRVLGSIGSVFKPIPLTFNDPVIFDSSILSSRFIVISSI
jgi:hypothetical protein